MPGGVKMSVSGFDDSRTAPLNAAGHGFRSPTCRLAGWPSFGTNLGSITAALMRLFQRWGAVALQAAITEALDRGVPHPNAVRLALERAREASGQPPPIALVLPEHVARRDAPVRSHDLRSYDRKPEPKPESQPEGDHPETDDE